MKDKIISGVIGVFVGGLVIFGYGSFMNNKQVNDLGENIRGQGRGSLNTEGNTEENRQQRAGNATETRTNLVGEASIGETGSGEVLTEKTGSGKTIRQDTLNTIAK